MHLRTEAGRGEKLLPASHPVLVTSCPWGVHASVIEVCTCAQMTGFCKEEEEVGEGGGRWGGGGEDSNEEGLIVLASLRVILEADCSPWSSADAGAW